MQPLDQLGYFFGYCAWGHRQPPTDRIHYRIYSLDPSSAAMRFASAIRDEPVREGVAFSGHIIAYLSWAR